MPFLPNRWLRGNLSPLFVLYYGCETPNRIGNSSFVNSVTASEIRSPIVQSLISFTRRSVVSLDEFEALLISRVHAMARAHDILMQAAGEGATLGSIIEAVIAPFGRSRFMLRGPNVWLASNPAVRFGLAIHELATNASKHGALAADAGQIDVRWAADTTMPPGLLNLSWAEIGGPEVARPPSLVPARRWSEPYWPPTRRVQRALIICPPDSIFGRDWRSRTALS